MKYLEKKGADELLYSKYMTKENFNNYIKDKEDYPELKILDISWNCIGDDLVIIPSYEELANSQIRHPDKNFDNFALEEALGSQKLNLRRNPFLPPLDEKAGKKEDICFDDSHPVVRTNFIR